MFSILLDFNFIHFPSNWFFGVRQDAVYRSISHRQGSQFYGMETLIQGFLRYPARNTGNSKWNWFKLKRLQASQTGYYNRTRWWITSYLGSWIINEFENLGKWGSALGKQYLRVNCPKGKLEIKYFSSPVITPVSTVFTAPCCFSFDGVVHRGFPCNIWLIDHRQYSLTL